MAENDNESPVAEKAAPVKKRRNVRPKRADKAVVDGGGQVATLDASEILSQMREMRELLASMRQENADLRTRVEQAEQLANDKDEYGLNNNALLGTGLVNSGTDRPATLEDKLNCMERQALIAGETFDREFTRLTLLGLPRNDPNANKTCTVCGKVNDAWAVPEIMEQHAAKCFAAKQRAIARAAAE